MSWKDDLETIREQAELISHFKNLFGYTREGSLNAIEEIRRDCTPEEGVEPTDLQAMLLERADDIEASLDAIEDVIG